MSRCKMRGSAPTLLDEYAYPGDTRYAFMNMLTSWSFYLLCEC